MSGTMLKYPSISYKQFGLVRRKLRDSQRHTEKVNYVPGAHSPQVSHLLTSGLKHTDKCQRGSSKCFCESSSDLLTSALDLDQRPVPSSLLSSASIHGFFMSETQRTCRGHTEDACIDTTWSTWWRMLNPSAVSVYIHIY